ncbi:MAG: GxxExxY protein [Patescibacteria group bacterium]|nr:GxxExxY protein [Patescibacteria group bacterium]
MAELIYKDESYAIVGAALKVFNELGFGYQEKYYYRGLKNAFNELGFKVVEQLTSPLVVGGKPIGRYFLDFLLEKNDARIVVELKWPMGFIISILGKYMVTLKLIVLS